MLKSFATKSYIYLESLAEIPLLASVRHGLTLVLPLIIIGAVSLLLLNLPVPQLHSFLTYLMGDQWKIFCRLIQQCSFNIAALAAMVCISFTYAKYKASTISRYPANPRVAVVVCLACYFILVVPLEGDIPRDIFSIGSGGFPLAFFTAVVGTPVFLFLLQRIPGTGYFYTRGVDSDFRDAFTAIPATLVLFFLLASFRLWLHGYGIDSLPELTHNLFAPSFHNGSLGLPGAIGYICCSQFLWFFGIHGPNLLHGVEVTFLTPALLENMAAVAAGGIPHNILTKPFFDTFVHIGGSGGTFALIIAILLCSRDISSRHLALVAILPAFCNVNEIILFGLPLVFNPLYAIPFLLAPLVQLLIAYAATSFGFVPITVANVHWTSPVLLGGYSATAGSVSGALLQVACLAGGTLTYLPFVQMANRMQQRRVDLSMKKLCRAIDEDVSSYSLPRCTNLPGPVGKLARSLALDIVAAVEKGKDFSLAYQPQMDVSRKRPEPVGAEALLRWEHPVHGAISPALVIELAQEMGIIDKLTMAILRKSCQQQMVLYNRGFCDLCLSVNVPPMLFYDELLPDKIAAILAETGFPRELLKIEVTETMALAADNVSVRILQRLRGMGVKIAIDDFGMGHTSLRYIREFPVQTVKIDRSLTLESPGNINDSIVKSIVNLCTALNIQIIVEGVETKEQLERFKAHGCYVYQGYYFSKPLPEQEYLAFFEKKGPLRLVVNQ